MLQVPGQETATSSTTETAANVASAGTGDRNVLNLTEFFELDNIKKRSANFFHIKRDTWYIHALRQCR
jgi:hypothetical protein